MKRKVVFRLSIDDAAHVAIACAIVASADGVAERLAIVCYALQNEITSMFDPDSDESGVTK